VNLQTVRAIVDEAQLSEAVHEETHSRAGCANHLCEGLLADSRDYSVGHAVLTEMRQQQQNPGELTPWTPSLGKLCATLDTYLRGDRSVRSAAPRSCGMF